jgi:hypothetical protein
VIIGDNGASAEGSLQGCFNEMTPLSGFADLETVEFLTDRFGPHPQIPFLPCDRELVLLLDRHHPLEIVGEYLSTDTNYRPQTIRDLEGALAFAPTVGFPSHGLVIKPQGREAGPWVKGIVTETHLVQAVTTALQQAQVYHCQRRPDPLPLLQSLGGGDRTLAEAGATQAINRKLTTQTGKPPQVSFRIGHLANGGIFKLQHRPTLDAHQVIVLLDRGFLNFIIFAILRQF